jgi:aryl-alcohol dehydrogenase-like predicted oxidoreductase
MDASTLVQYSSACFELAAPMHRKQVPIPGAKDLAQAKENLGALGWRLSAAEVAELDAVASGLKKGMIQNIFQTS